jgi:hypothetical protein
MLLRDDDQQFAPGIHGVRQAEGVAVKRVAPLAPNPDAVAERFVRCVRAQCSDRRGKVGVRGGSGVSQT